MTRLKQLLNNNILLAFALSTGVQQANAQVNQQGDVTVYTARRTDTGVVDYVNAKAMPLPQNSAPFDAVQSTVRALLTAQGATASAGSSDGAAGSGIESPLFLGAPAAPRADGNGRIEPQEWGTANLPFSTARADLSSTTNTMYPYRASGKLYFTDGASSYFCSASLIKRGVVVTAAHCVAKFGQSRYYTNFRFVPGYRNGSAPFGTWTAASVTVKTSYFNGTDPCSTYGVVCQNDVAVIKLSSQAGTYPGTQTGWYCYGWDGYGFVNNTTHISQIGYPVCLDNGQLMERNDAQGIKNVPQTNNTTYGSLMCGGSSGGPLAVNYGIRPTLTATGSGTGAVSNTVVGVTSWGYTNSAVKQQGASPFTSGNIVVLVNAVCSGGPAWCI